MYKTNCYNTIIFGDPILFTLDLSIKKIFFNLDENMNGYYYDLKKLSKVFNVGQIGLKWILRLIFINKLF